MIDLFHVVSVLAVAALAYLAGRRTAVPAPAAALPLHTVVVSPPPAPPDAERIRAATIAIEQEHTARLAVMLAHARAEQAAFESVHAVAYDEPSRRRAIVARIERALHHQGQPQIPDLARRIRSK